MRAKVCYTLSPKLYHKCKPIATNRSAFPRRPCASSPYRRSTKSDRSHDSSRVQGELRSALRHTLDPAAPTTYDRDSVHRLPTSCRSTLRATMKIPLLRPRLHQIRRATLAVPRESIKRSRGGSLPFEAVIAGSTIPSIEARLRSPIFQNASRWLCGQRPAASSAHHRGSRSLRSALPRHERPPINALIAVPNLVNAFV